MRNPNPQYWAAALIIALALFTGVGYAYHKAQSDLPYYLSSDLKPSWPLWVSKNDHTIPPFSLNPRTSLGSHSFQQLGDFGFKDLLPWGGEDAVAVFLCVANIL